MSQAKLPFNDIAGPDVLVAHIRAVAPTWNPALARAEYDTNRATWQLYLDLLELDEIKLKELVERHGTAAEEPDEKLDARKKLAVVFNLVPTIVGMFAGYIFSDEPQIDVKGDKDLEAFLEDCTGGGVKLVDWLRLKALPYAVGMGWLDTLVQNPGGDFAGDADAPIKPAVYAITPLHRVNWSANNASGYNWLTFRDFGNENPDPFAASPVFSEGFITMSAARPGVRPMGQDNGPALPPDAGFWIKSIPGVKISEGLNGGTSSVWNIVADFTPTKRCAVASLFYRESLDPARRHFGVSKIGTIAVLTRAIINVLSWTTEDILANLALMAIPSKGGKPPIDAETHEPISPTLTPTTILWYDPTAVNAEPKWLQGATAHITVKMEYVAALVQEILRQANLLGVSGETDKVTSGVQGVVMRSELFQELSTVATALDNFALDLFALVKSWATGEDWTRERVLEEIGPTISFHKGPYTVDPLDIVIKNAQAVVSMFGRVSPIMAESAFKLVARCFLYADDPALPDIIKEIEENTGGALDTIIQQMQQLNADMNTDPATPPAPGESE